MGCRLYLVRHGETAWNSAMKFQGQSDVPLSERGREQAQRLAGRLAKNKPAAFYASDLKRAAQTAAILAGPHGLPVETTPCLRELNFGVWEGLTWQEINERHAGLVECWRRDPLTNRITDGENLQDLAARVNKTMAQIAQRHSNGGEVVVVSHGGPLRVFIATLLGMDLRFYWRLRLDNAGLCIVDCPEPEPGRGVLVLFNDCSHLEE